MSLSLSLSLSLSIYLSISLSLSLSIYLSISIYLSVCLSISPLTVFPLVITMRGVSGRGHTSIPFADLLGCKSSCYLLIDSRATEDRPLCILPFLLLLPYSLLLPWFHVQTMCVAYPASFIFRAMVVMFLEHTVNYEQWRAMEKLKDLENDVKVHVSPRNSSLSAAWICEGQLYMHR